MTSKRRWLPDELALVSDLSVDDADVALELGRSIGSVKTIRLRMANGWKPKKPFIPLTEEQIEYIATHPEATAKRVAERLGVPYALVTKERRILSRERDISFGTGPYDKSPHVVGPRFLLGRTCPRCGVLRGGGDFNRDGRRVSGICKFCRATTREPDDKRAREVAVMDLASRVGVPYRAHHNEEYTLHDMDVLADPTLSVVEKAARLGRTYAAIGMAVQTHGFSSRIEPRGEPCGLWIIDSNTELAAISEPDRSQFGKRQRKTHCKWGHELTPENRYYWRDRSYCAECIRVRNRSQPAPMTATTREVTA